MPINRSEYQIHIGTTIDPSGIDKTKTGLTEVGQAAKAASDITKSTAAEATAVHAQTAESVSDAAEKIKETGEKRNIAHGGLEEGVQGVVHQLPPLAEALSLVENLKEAFSQLTQTAREAAAAIRDTSAAMNEYRLVAEGKTTQELPGRAKEACSAVQDTDPAHEPPANSQRNGSIAAGNGKPLDNHEVHVEAFEDQPVHETGPTAIFDISELVSKARTIEANLHVQRPNQQQWTELHEILDRIIGVQENQCHELNSLRDSLHDVLTRLGNQESYQQVNRA